MNNTETRRNIARPSMIEPVTSIGVRHDGRSSSNTAGSRRCRLLAFFEELRRRKVCRALTMYAVTLWLVSQVVDLAYLHFGLPDWTLQFVIVAGLAGLPIAVLLSWLFDLTPDAVIVDSDGRATRLETPDSYSDGTTGRLVDWLLLLMAIAITANLAVASMNGPTPTTTPDYERIAVTPFRVGPGADSMALSEGLMTELQHELASRARYTVVAPRDPFSAANCVTLTGSIATDDGHIRITVALINNRSMEIVWSDTILRDRTDALMTTADIARDIVSVLRLSGTSTSERETHDGD